MDIERSHLLVASLAAILIAGLGFPALDNAAPEEDGKKTTEDWRQVELQDVRTGEHFTVAELEKPVLVETFAVWCPTCTRQQQEIKKLHEESGVTSVSLNVDPNEDRKKVEQHIQRYGFDWHFAVAPSEMTRLLVREFGTSIAHPPSAPAVLVCENGTRRLPDGVKPVSKLKQEIEKGC